MKRKDFEKLKEKEKAHLLEIQKLKQRLREAERVRSIGKALDDIESAGSVEELDEALAKVHLEALESEAKLDLILDADREAGGDPELDEAEAEAEFSRARAAELVRHMKMSMGLDDYGKPDDSSGSEAAGKKSVGRDRARQSDVPDDAGAEEPGTGKSIGRMKPGDE